MNKNKPTQDEDKALLSRCFSGDRKASETLVLRFSNLVYRSIQHILMIRQVAFNTQDLEDLHNTVFLRLFENRCKKLRQYQGKNGCSLASWIRIVTVRIVLNHLRKKGIDSITWQKRRIALENLPEFIGDEPSPWVEMEKAEQENMLEHGMRKLPPRDRLFMKLHFDHGLTVPEVAETMQLSVDNVYTVKHRAIQRLKAYLKTTT